MSGPLRVFTKLSELPIKSSFSNRVPKTRRGLQDAAELGQSAAFMEGALEDEMRPEP